MLFSGNLKELLKLDGGYGFGIGYGDCYSSGIGYGFGYGHGYYGSKQEVNPEVFEASGCTVEEL